MEHNVLEMLVATQLCSIQFFIEELDRKTMNGKELSLFERERLNDMYMYLKEQGDYPEKTYFENRIKKLMGR